MKKHSQTWATIGLIFITFISAIQYVFLRNVPESVPTFAFVCITNLIGLFILGIAQFREITRISGKALKKGALFAIELTGVNFFMLLGSRRLDSVIISSVASLYFVFITPILVLFKKKINFFSGIATVIATIALVLMFGADTEMLFASSDMIYLIIADIFFAAYVVSVSVFGEEEDSRQLTFSQMLFSSCFAFVGWLVESAVSGQRLSLPVQTDFWLSAVFIGVFIRAIYGLLQIECQKHVSALKASLIFASEILITLLINPVMCGLLNVTYTPVTTFQVIGAILFIVATLMVDDNLMMQLGYEDLREITYVTIDGEKVERTSVAKKIISTTLAFALIALVLSAMISLSSIYFIRSSAVTNSKELGENASEESASALMLQLEKQITDQAADKTLLAAQKLEAYTDSIQMVAAYAHSLYSNPDNYPDKEVQRPRHENEGIWTMQRGLANESIDYETVRKESGLIGNLEDVFAPIVANNENISTIYLGVESGLMISYDPYSADVGDAQGELYFDFFHSPWYTKGREIRECVFTDTYQDNYGRGLTITCVSPIFDAQGEFYGCVAMDVLMSELNASLVNDGIIMPSVATLIDREGKYIAGKNVDPTAEDPGSIFDASEDEALRSVGREILEKKKGIVSTGEGEDAQYIAFSTIPSTDWTLCVMTPVSSVLQPAVAIRESIDQNTENVVGSVMQGIMTVIQRSLVLSAIILIFVTLFAGNVSKRVSDPLKQLESDVKTISGGNLDYRTQVTTDDEIGSLANSFNVMTDSLQQYIADLKEVTAKEQRIAGELTAATNIQASMLPRNFSEFSRDRNFDIFATMHPAKEVGGDFYDFFMVDDDHLCLVMADVSGKGVPAALFMVVAKTLIKNHAQNGESPSEILANVNNQLCDGNEGELFVTVWLAIVELSTGKGCAANAGHEHPVICRKGGQYELVVYRHSPAVATMEGLPFRQHEFELNPGDRLFVYTDGVAEATDAHDVLFGTDRMLDALNRDADAAPEQLLRNVREDIDAFVGAAPQFDDITMLGLYYKGGENNG